MASFIQFNILYVIFILTIFRIDTIIAGKICDTNDEECTKSGAKEAYTLFVNGVDNLVESSDPVSLDHIKANLPTVKYALSNAELRGLKGCDVTLMSVQKTNSSFNFHLYCPVLELNADYTLLGYIEDMFVEGEGKFTVKPENYLLKFHGVYELTTGKDEKQHVHIKNYFIEVGHKGKVTFNFQNLYGGDKDKTDAVNNYLNQHWKDMDQALRAPALYAFMDIFIENLNNFLAVSPVEQIFPELS